MEYSEAAKVVFAERMPKWCRAKLPDWDANELFIDYSILVADAEAGIRNEDIEEYFDRLSSRDALQVLLEAPELAHFPEHSSLRNDVELLDMRFRAALIPGAPLKDLRGFWWEQSLPRRADKQFVEDAMAQFGVELEPLT